MSKPVNTDNVIIIGRDLEDSKSDEYLEKSSSLFKKNVRHLTSIGQISKEELKEEFDKITNSIKYALQDANSSLSMYHLSEITVSLELSANGTIAILGNGVSASGTGGIELKFSLKHNES